MTRRVLPVSTSYTHPLITTESGTSLDCLRNSTSASTALSKSANARKSNSFCLSSSTADCLDAEVDDRLAN